MTTMQAPLPQLDLVDARVIATHYTPARKFVPGFWSAWLRLSDGSGPVQIKASELRGLRDLGYANRHITSIEERASTPFATGTPPTPVFEKGRPGRIFAIQGELDHRFVAAPKGELIAADLRVLEAPEEIAPVPQIAAPIPWEQATTMLTLMRLLHVTTVPDEAGMTIRIFVGAPRGTYVLVGPGGVRLEDQGYPGDSGIGKSELEETAEGTWIIRLHPGGKGAGHPALEAEAERWTVHKVVPVEE